MPMPKHEEEDDSYFALKMAKYGSFIFAFFIPLIFEILYPANEKLIGVNVSFKFYSKILKIIYLNVIYFLIISPL